MVENFDSFYVYVAGPLTNGDVAQNVTQAINAANLLLINNCVPYVPHLSHFWHMMHPHSGSMWIAYDLKWLDKCNVLWRLPGFSPGAEKEIDYALKNKIPVCFSLDDVLRLKRKEMGE